MSTLSSLIRVCRVRVALFLVTLFASPALAQRVDPYAAEGRAQDLARANSLSELTVVAHQLAETARTAHDLATVAELFKRLGAPGAGEYYERAIAADPQEPGLEILLAQYLRVNRGAGQRPLFYAAQEHLLEASRKLNAVTLDPAVKQEWDDATRDRLTRAQATLYERDGAPLAATGASDAATPRRPWLFLGVNGLYDRTAADIDQSSDNRLLTLAAILSAALDHRFTLDDYRQMAHVLSPRQAGFRLRARTPQGPSIDASFKRRNVPELQITDLANPTAFNDFTLADTAVSIEQPVALPGTTDLLVRGGYHRIRREGLIEHEPLSFEWINQVELAASVAHYVGPDRINVDYTFATQNIGRESSDLTRDRQFNGATVTYQIFRPLPLPRRDLNTGAGRRFETRGVDLSVGFLDDTENFPATPIGIDLIRRDYFIGVSAKGLGRLDLSVRPTWFTGRSSNDAFSDTSHLRLSGNALIRILDEERTAGMPTERFLGLPVASVHLVVPFHRDTTGDTFAVFGSRRIGAEVWTKLLRSDGLALLLVGGYSRQWYPQLDHSLDLCRIELNLGF
jgi:hypothetical protein